jgi:hypothetical protein
MAGDYRGSLFFPPIIERRRLVNAVSNPASQPSSVLSRRTEECSASILASREGSGIREGENVERVR